MLREMKLVLKSNCESLPSFEPLFTQFTQYEQARGPCAQGMRKEPDFFYHNSGMPNSMRPFPIQNFIFLMMHVLMLLTTLNEISLHITICFIWSKTLEYMCRLLHK